MCRTQVHSFLAHKCSYRADIFLGCFTEKNTRAFYVLQNIIFRVLWWQEKMLGSNEYKMLAIITLKTF